MAPNMVGSVCKHALRATLQFPDIDDVDLVRQLFVIACAYLYRHSRHSCGVLACPACSPLHPQLLFGLGAVADGYVESVQEACAVVSAQTERADLKCTFAKHL